MRTRDQRGAAAVELTLVVPALVVMLGLLIAGGRLWFARTTVAEAASASARAASLARGPEAAVAAARTAAQRSLATAGLSCSATSIAVDVGGFAVPVGSPASVSATVTCIVSFADVTLPGMPGSLTLRADGVSALDTYRSR